MSKRCPYCGKGPEADGFYSTIESKEAQMIPQDYRAGLAMAATLCHAEYEWAKGWLDPVKTSLGSVAWSELTGCKNAAFRCLTAIQRVMQLDAEDEKDSVDCPIHGVMEGTICPRC